MSQLRKDPITREWVCIATERAKRPSDFSQKANTSRSPQVQNAVCPFCLGSEHLNPSDILVLRREGANEPWSVRVVPNKFPALLHGAEPTIVRHGMFEMMAGIGSHEVVIETPEHGKSLAHLDQLQIEHVLQAYKERFLALEAERHKYILIFRNHGKIAGASLEHAHSQIIASPMVPQQAWLKIQGVARYEEYSGRCVYCDIVEQETRDGERMVAESESFVCFTPFASRHPFEFWILPKRRDAHFARIDSEQIHDLAAILKEALLRLNCCLDDPPYNYALLTTAFSNDFHWHIEIVPRLTIAGGFELGTGIYINPVAPEEAAACLRSVSLPIAASTAPGMPNR